MTDIRHRQDRPLPEAAYSELYIPDDSYLGTGVFELGLLQSAFDKKTFVIEQGKRPEFSLSLSVDSANSVMSVNLGHHKFGLYEPTSHQMYALLHTADKPLIVLRVPFEMWRIGTVTLDGVALVSSIKRPADTDWLITTNAPAENRVVEGRIPRGGAFPEHEGTIIVAFPEANLPEEYQKKLLETFRSSAGKFVFMSHHQGNTSLDVYRDEDKSLVYHHWNPSFGDRRIVLQIADLLDESFRALLLSFTWALPQSSLHATIVRKDGTQAKRDGYAFSGDKLLLVENTLRQFDEILASASREEAAHQFLKSNPILLGLTSSIEPLSKLRLGDDYVTDFVIREPAGGYVFIEIERPGLSLFKKGTPPERTAELNHALEQLESWRAWISNHHMYLSAKLDGLTPDPMCWLVAARRARMTAGQLRRLDEINATYRNVYRIFTYDDISDRVRNILIRVRAAQ